MPRQTFALALRRLCGDMCGASTVEQSLFIAMIVGAAFLAVDGLGDLAKQTLIATADHLDTEGSHQLSGVVSHRTRATSSSAEASYPFVFQLALLLLVSLAGVLCCYLRYRPQGAKSQESEIAPLAPQADEQIERDLIFDKRHNLLRLLSTDIGILMTGRLLVRHVMSEKLHRVPANCVIDEIRVVMEENNVRHVVVCNNVGGLLGLITAPSLEHTDGKTANDVMERNAATISPGSLLSPAITQLIKQRLSCLPVIDDGKLVGIVTRTDIMMAMQCTLNALQKTVNEVVADLPAGVVPGFMLAARQLDEANSEIVPSSQN